MDKKHLTGQAKCLSIGSDIMSAHEEDHGTNPPTSHRWRARDPGIALGRGTGDDSSAYGSTLSRGWTILLCHRPDIAGTSGSEELCPPKPQRGGAHVSRSGWS